MAHNMWGIGGSDVTKMGKRDSHRAKPIHQRAGKFAHEHEFAALAEAAGVSVKRVKRDLHIWRKAGIVPSWA
jgi:hypothetical protein